MRPGKVVYRADPGPWRDFSAKPGCVSVEVPMTLPSVANARLHWAAKARLVKSQRKATALALRGWRTRGPLEGLYTSLHVGDSRLTVILTRVAMRSLDSDNLAAAFKGVRDQVAAHLGVDDADPRVMWRYAQYQGKPAAVRIEFQVTT